MKMTIQEVHGRLLAFALMILSSAENKMPLKITANGLKNVQPTDKCF